MKRKTICRKSSEVFFLCSRRRFKRFRLRRDGDGTTTFFLTSKAFSFLSCVFYHTFELLRSRTDFSNVFRNFFTTVRSTGLFIFVLTNDAKGTLFTDAEPKKTEAY